MTKYWSITAKANRVGELTLYGEIANNEVFGDEVTPKKIDEELKKLGELEILNVYVNSPGGSVTAGMSLFNIIQRNSAKVKNCYIDGLAGSIASIIILACDNIYIPSNGLIFVHLPQGGVYGNRKAILKMADTLDVVLDSMVAVYKEKTGLSEKKIISLLEADTWMGADEAVKLGFATHLQDDLKISASISDKFLTVNKHQFDIKKLENLESLKAIIEQNLDARRLKLKCMGAIVGATETATAEQNKKFTALKLKLMEGVQK